MELTLYKNFKKRINSTKRPSGGTTQEVYLKQDTSLKSPTFILEDVDLDVNYCKYAGHYYYVTDITLNMYDQYELVCSMDDLASHKDEIGSTTAYVEYSSATYNKWVPDQRITFSEDADVENIRYPLFSTETGGTYIVSVIGTGNNAVTHAQVGITNYWAVPANQFQYLKEALFSNSIIGEIANSTTNALNCIIDCHWVPYTIPGMEGPYYAITLGKHDTDAGGVGLKGYANTIEHIKHITMTIPWDTEDWTMLNPYTKLSVWLPYYGYTELDPADFIDEGEVTNTVIVDVSADPISGMIMYGLRYGKRYQTFKCECAVSIPLTQIRTNQASGVAEIVGGALAAGGAALTIASSGLSAATAAAALGGVASIGKGVISQFSQDASSKGGISSFAQTNLYKGNVNYSDIHYLFQRHIPAIDSISNINSIEGRPLFDTRQISTIPGYIKCAGASVNMAGLESDKVTINNYLNSGFYYE